MDRSPEPAPNGHDPYDRVHVHLTPRDGAWGELVEVITTLLRELALEHPDDVVTVRLHTPEPHDNSAPNPPAPNVVHTMPAERVHLVIAEVAFSSPLARRRVHASATFQNSLPHQGRLVSHLAAFAVSGVHTFVRNGRLTTAGLRGSRVAQLIDDLAAANQVGDDVAHLMRTGTLRRDPRAGDAEAARSMSGAYVAT